MRIYKIFAVVSASNANAASVQVLRNGTVKLIQWAVSVTSITASAVLDAEIHTLAQTQIGTNNTAGPLTQMSTAGNFVTSGLSQHAVNFFTPLEVRVAAGESLYLNTFVSGTLSARVTVLIHVAD